MPKGTSLKVYVHVAGKTTVFRDVPFDATVDDLCTYWVGSVENSQPSGSIRASTVKGRPLQGSQVISRALGPNPELCLAVTSQQEHAQNSSGDGSRSNRTHQTDISQAIHEKLAPVGIVPVLETSESRVSTSPLIAPLLERAAEKEASQRYKSAAFIYEQVGAL